MCPVIRVDDQVWEWLKEHAKPLEDTPNTVLRRLAGLDAQQRAVVPQRSSSHGPSQSARPARERSNYGRQLNEKWNVGARHALYHKDGNYYNHLRHFPGALMDPNGFVVFKTEKEYLESPRLQHGTQLHVPGGIASLPGYVRKTK